MQGLWYLETDEKIELIFPKSTDQGGTEWELQMLELWEKGNNSTIQGLIFFRNRHFIAMVPIGILHANYYNVRLK